MLSEFYGKPPGEIIEGELEAYFPHRRNVDHWSPNTMRICYCGVRFNFVRVLQRNWHLFDTLRGNVAGPTFLSEACVPPFRPRRWLSKARRKAPWPTAA